MSSAQTIPAEDTAVSPPRRGIKKGLYLIPSLFTAANIGMGFYALMATLRGFQLLSVGGEVEMAIAASYFDAAAKAIGWAFLFDSLDGRIARMTKTATEIGVQLDSIADVVTFGLAPAMLAYAWGYGSALKEGSDAHKLAWFLSFMFLMCGAFRLARFNVQAARPRVLAEGATKVDKKSFVGLPIPAAAALIAAIVHFAPRPLVQYEPRLAELYSGLMMALVGVLGGLMVSTIRYSSFKTVGTRRGSARVIILLVALGALIWLFSRHVLLAITILYVLQGLVFRLAAVFRRHPEKTDS
jgi:CDP-diacylglycerol---serine O-phosphatidyltransferase